MEFLELANAMWDGNDRPNPEYGLSDCLFSEQIVEAHSEEERAHHRCVSFRSPVCHASTQTHETRHRQDAEEDAGVHEADRAEAITRAGAKPFEPTPGRGMKEYVELPARVIADADALRGWLERGSAYVGTLAKKGAKKRT